MKNITNELTNNGKIITKYFIHDGIHRFYGVKLKDIESWKEK